MPSLPAWPRHAQWLAHVRPPGHFLLVIPPKPGNTTEEYTASHSHMTKFCQFLTECHKLWFPEQCPVSQPLLSDEDTLVTFTNAYSTFFSRIF